MKLYQRYAPMAVADVLREFAVGEQGMTAVEALRRRAQSGSNEIREEESSWVELLGRHLATALNLLLLGAAFVSVVLGEFADAATIIVILLINAGLGFFQEYRSEQAVRSLRKFLTGTSRVRRGGTVQTVPRSEIVPGDIVLLKAGDLAPADLRVIRAEHALADESALTGESAPVAKQSETADESPRDYHAATSVVFSGTTLVGGTLEGIAVATGEQMEVGALAALTAQVRRRSAFEENIARFSRFILVLVAVTLAVLFVAKLFFEGSLDRSGELLLFSLALAISVVPEALPVVMTITFSRGALHLARRHVVVRRLSAIEDLGHIEILCADKTGTLTENRLRVAALAAPDEDACLRLAGESIAPPPEGEEPHDPFDRAIWNKLPAAFRASLRVRRTLADLPFDHERRRSSVVVPSATGALLIVKGAPEVVLERSGHQDGQALTASRREQILRAFADFGLQGYRVLGLATKSVASAGPWDERDERELEWRGLVAFEDPLKPSAKAAIALAERLNVRVKILTGDSREVAGAIAAEAGIVARADAVVTGADLDALDAAAFARAAEEHDVFARVSPEQKYRIIDALQHRHAVGFLGEGINDAPALKLANVALAVPSAADVSKHAADAILLDRSLAVIIDGIREGRAMVANVSKYIRYTLAGNFGNFVSIAAVSLFLPYLPMLPVQILLTNLLTDLPLIALAADRVDTGELARPRRFNIKDLVFSAVVLGLVSAVFDLILFGLYRAAAPATLQTLWFTFSILAELATIFVIRTSLPALRARAPAASLVWTSAVAAAVAIALPFTPFGQNTFHFIAPTPRDFGIMLALVAGVVVMTEMAKLMMRKYFRNSHSTSTS